MTDHKIAKRGHDLEDRGTKVLQWSSPRLSPMPSSQRRFRRVDSRTRRLLSRGSMKMSIRKFEIERFSATSYRPLDAVVAALKDAVGRLYLAEFAKACKQPGPLA